MKLGTLEFTSIQRNDALATAAVSEATYAAGLETGVFVAKIDPAFADTAIFCEQYQIDMAVSTNCLVIEARRGDKTWYCACLVLATDMADVNGVIRKTLGARKTSFASKEIALKLTDMEYGGITPIGLPEDWTIYIDDAIMNQPIVVIGSGMRGSKVAVETGALRGLPNTEVLDIKRAV